MEPFLGIMGLDLGKQMDLSAMAGVQLTKRPNPLRPHEQETMYDVLALHEWERGTLYHVVVADVCSWVALPPWAGQSLAFDRGESGNAVFEIFQNAQPNAWLRPIRITGGQAETPQVDDGWNVAKSQLASVLVAVHASLRIRIAEQPLRKRLAQQLAMFSEKISKDGAQSFDTIRDASGHADLGMALALAIWLGERTPISWDGSLGGPVTPAAGGSVMGGGKGAFMTDPQMGAWTDPGYHQRRYYFPDGRERPPDREGPNRGDVPPWMPGGSW